MAQQVDENPPVVDQNELVAIQELIKQAAVKLVVKMHMSDASIK